MRRKAIARKVVTAGLGLAMALGGVAPSVALAASTGETGFYVTVDDSGITTPEGAVDENIKVVIPVAINYVADAEGNLTGPSDLSVAIRNNSLVGTVNVSKIRAEAEPSLNLVSSAQSAIRNNDVYLTMTTDTDDTISLRDYSTESTPTMGKWDIAKGAQLRFKNLTGKIGGFDAIDPSTRTKLATVHWTVAAGTAEQASEATRQLVRVHFSADGQQFNDLVVSRSEPAGSLPYGFTWKTKWDLPMRSAADAVSAAGSDSEITLYGTPNE